ncbi:MAG TPA: AraC family transcriptional regulator [Xanthobacteraceae bacterium]
MAAAGTNIAGGTAAAFPIEETHGIPLYPGNRLIAHSGGLGWRNVYASYAVEQPWTATLRPLAHPCIAYFVNGGARIARRVEGEAPQNAVLHARQFGMVPTRTASDWELDGTPEILTLYLRNTVVNRAAEEVFGRDPKRVELRPQLGVIDPLLEQLALAILRAMRESEAGDRLYIDHLAQTMTVHLLRSHCSGIGGRVLANALPGSNLTRALDYIDATIDGELTLDALAEVAGMNPFYFARAFRRRFGASPHRFVLQRRVERAKRLLTETGTPLVEIALACGFASQSHFTATFHRHVGITPSEYRKG